MQAPGSTFQQELAAFRRRADPDSAQIVLVDFTPREAACFQCIDQRAIVGGFTCSALASCASEVGPPNTSTDSAEARGPDKPI